jgi:hypothetical protein
MYAPTANLPPSQPVLMRLLVRSWDYRRPQLWVRIRVACAIWNLILGTVLLGSGHWLGSAAWVGVVPLAGSALLFWTAYRLQHTVQR